MQTFISINQESLVKNKSTQQSVSFNTLLPEYDSGLIDVLENDHQELIMLFNRVKESAIKKEFSRLQLSLVEFATSFTNHINVEDELLYGYVNKLASKKSNLEQKIAAQFSAEMKHISVTIFDFLSNSPFIPVTQSNVDEFIEAFENIGALLLDRIQREEKVLYPIYARSQNAST